MLTEWQLEIEAGKLPIFMINECHLLWGDVLGYPWERTDKKIEIPLKNEFEIQTYYGTLDYQTKEFILQSYRYGNTENAIEYIKYLHYSKPLFSIGEERDKDCYVVFSKRGGAIINEHTGAVRKFPRLANGTYEMTMRLPPASIALSANQGFPGQGR